MENGNTPNPAPQGGPVKYCTACGASLHVQAEICPKCGVRQTPPPGASAGTASSKTGGGKNRWLIGCGALLALLVIGLLVARSQYPKQLMQAHNKSAESDLRNLSINEEFLYQEHKVYGVTCRGIAEAGCAETQYLIGPHPPAMSGSGSEGAQIGATLPGGKRVSTPITVDSGVFILAQTTGGGYFAIAKHVNGDRVFLTTSQSGGYYFCKNEAWIGKADHELVSYPDVPTDIEGKPCGGSPVSTWQKL